MPDKNKTKNPGKEAYTRRHVRFKPDPLHYALIDSHNREGIFTPDLIALISEEAPMGGCGLVIIGADNLQVHSVCRVKVGELAPLKAEVAWRKTIDKQLTRVGFKFLE